MIYKSKNIIMNIILKSVFKSDIIMVFLTVFMGYDTSFLKITNILEEIFMETVDNP